MTYDNFNDRTKRVCDALLSVPVSPRDTFQPRLAQAAYEADYSCAERDLWRVAQDDPELKHRVNAIHSWMCTLKLSEFTEIIERQLASQEGSAR